MRNLTLQDDFPVPAPPTGAPLQADERAELEMYRKMLGELHMPASLGEPSNIPSGPTSVPQFNALPGRPVFDAQPVPVPVPPSVQHQTVPVP